MNSMVGDATNKQTITRDLSTVGSEVSHSSVRKKPYFGDGETVGGIVLQNE